MIASTGEQVTIGLLAIALQELGLKAKSYTGGQVRILTDDAYTKARILAIDEANMRRDLDGGHVVIVAGFQGIDDDGNITTLGRGGSDTTGVALAAALKADECQIYTDVDGVYTTDPRIVPEARRLDDGHLRGNARAGEPRLQGAADPLGGVRGQVQGEAAGAVVVRRTGIDDMGTLITFEEDENMEQAIISGIAFNRDEAKITVLGVPDKPGIAFAILGPIADGQHRRRHDRAEHRRVGAHRLLVHRAPQRVHAHAGDARAGARQRFRRARSSATTTSPRSRSSASACARTPASPRRCSRRSPTRASTSR